MSVSRVPEGYIAIAKGEVIPSGSKFFQARSWVDVGMEFVGSHHSSDIQHCKPRRAKPHNCAMCGGIVPVDGECNNTMCTMSRELVSRTASKNMAIGTFATQALRMCDQRKYSADDGICVYLEAILKKVEE